MLLYDSSLPWIWRADATPGRVSAVRYSARALMWILAIAQRAKSVVQNPAEGAPLRRRLAISLGEPVGDRRVVDRRAGKGFLRHFAAEGETRRPVMALQFLEQRAIVVDIDDDDDVIVVLGRAADHRRAADVDIFDSILERRVAAQRRLERIEVDDQEIDRRDVVGDHRRLMGRVGADRQQPAVHARVEGLDPPVHHLGEAGDLRDVDDGEPGGAQGRAGAAGREQLDAARLERAGEIDQTRLVGNGDQRSTDVDDIRGHWLIAPQAVARRFAAAQ